MKVDSDNMISILRKFPEMVEKSLSLGDDITFPRQLIENIIVVGMGGSGYNGDLLKVYIQNIAIPVHVVKDYKLPKFASKKSLIFAVSYSGNTEETISAYRSAIRRGFRIVSIASDGKLEELVKMNKNPHIKIPSGIQPRLSTAYQFIGMLNVLSYSGIIEDQEQIIKKTVKDLKNSAKEIEESGKELAAKLKGKTPIIYSSQKMFCVAEKWKTDINENAKTHAFYNMFPEFNHNEICAYENPVGNFHIVIVSDKDDHEKIKKRIKVFKNIIKKYKTPVTEIAITGDSLLTRLISSIWMGLFTAYYLALEYEIDPTPTKLLDQFKKDMK